MRKAVINNAEKIKPLPDINGSTFLENHIDAHYGRQDKLADRVVGRDGILNLQHIIVRAGKKLLANTGPFFGDMGKFLLTGHKFKVPTGPLALKTAQDLVAGIQDVKSATD